ncbi:uncharacterized protein NPIL_219142 [Nephila pilipes]|uniref:Uncharacterized protein n=1 Tax=Nephila pilipes TaxID=299642 RepID=A0A8X6UH42_NEPPI|nr:uncharacterized protein NPIL_219142 [Nephila pilipes]
MLSLNCGASASYSLPEFTKECPTTQNTVSKQDCKPDLVNTSKDEETPPSISPYEELAVNTNQYNYEYGEYTDVSGMLYPTSYVVYNPVEMPVYPSYIMPPDPCCYYYMPPEVAPVQEYTPVPYQEYIPPMKVSQLAGEILQFVVNKPRLLSSPYRSKDTVYLLLPAPTVRSSHGSPHVAYDWRNRRRRRRYVSSHFFILYTHT